MPLFDMRCGKCGKLAERFVQQGQPMPECCGAVMGRVWSLHNLKVKMGTELYIQRMEDIGKAENDRGERRKFVHPSRVM